MRNGTTLSYRRLAIDKARAGRGGTRRKKAPATRAECVDGPRPCPWVGCRHHLFLDVRDNGSIKFPHGADPRVERPPATAGADTNAERLRAMPETCSLDVAERGPHNNTQLGRLMGVTPEKVRQEIEDALRRLRRACRRMGMSREMFEGDEG